MRGRSAFRARGHAHQHQEEEESFEDAAAQAMVDVQLPIEHERPGYWQMDFQMIHLLVVDFAAGNMAEAGVVKIEVPEALDWEIGVSAPQPAKGPIAADCTAGLNLLVSAPRNRRRVKIPKWQSAVWPTDPGTHPATLFAAD